MSNPSFVHLTFSQLQEIRFTHLISGMDEDGPPDTGDAAVTIAITGYTEWIAGTTITLGWDWQMLHEKAAVRLSRISPPNSNLVLESAGGAELDDDKTDALLGAFVDSFDWQSQTLAYLNHRYNGQKT